MRLSRVITATNRRELVEALWRAPLGAQFDLIDEPRTSVQNRLMWAMLRDIANQCTIGGEKHDPEAWKAAFMHSIGVRSRFVPALDGEGVVAVGYSSSRLDKEKFSELIDAITEYAIEHHVLMRTDAA